MKIFLTLHNYFYRIPIKTKKELEHSSVSRGTYDVLYKEDLVLVGWKDNKAVYMASNTHGAAVKKTCRRYSRKDKREIMVRNCSSNFKYVLSNFSSRE
jgi:hypothetical protein